MKRRRRREETFQVFNQAQLRCLVSARRHDIVDRLVAGGPMSVREIAAAIHARPSALYYHLAALVRVGLVVEAGHRVVRRKRETLYATPAPRMRFQRAFQEPRNRPTFVRIAASMTRQMHRDFRGGIRSPRAVTAGHDRNLGLFRLVGCPNPKSLRTINQRLDEIAELLWNSARQGGEVVALAWILAPVGGPVTPPARRVPSRPSPPSTRKR